MSNPVLALNLDSANQTHKVTKGNFITVSISENAGTGFHWTNGDSDSNHIQYLGDTTLETQTTSENNPGTIVTGGPLVRVFLYKALQEGEGKINLHQLDPRQKIANNCSITFYIQPYK